MPDAIPVPSIHDPEAFRLALAPHHRRLKLARTFLDMDVTWAGQEAWMLRQLLLAMTGYLDGEAILRLAAARNRIDRAMGEPERDHIGEIRRRNGTGFAGSLQKVMDILDQGTWPGHFSIFKRPGVAALGNILEDLEERCLVIAPKRIAEMEAMAQEFEAMAGQGKVVRTLP